MSNTNHTFTKEQLFACLEYDGLDIDADTINEAKNEDEDEDGDEDVGRALRDIGYDYNKKLEDYSKAMAWYQLAANHNTLVAYTDIGALYHNGDGVSQDYITAMEYFFKAASGSEEYAMSNIGSLFLDGDGISVDKYKALEWFSKSGHKPEQVKKLNQQGIHLREEDKNKPIHQLINETEDILREVRMKRESKLKEENDQLKKRESKSNKEIQELNKVKSSNEKEIQRLRNKVQQQAALLEQERQKNGLSTQRNSNLEQRLLDKMEIINVYQTLVQSKSDEIKDMKEKQELKRKLDEYERRSRTLIENGNSTNDSNNDATTNNTIELDNQTPLSDTPNDNGVKIETGTENDSSPSCQTGNKKQKVSSNDS